LARTAGVSDIESACRRLGESGDLLELRLSPTRTIQLHREVFEGLGERILHTLEKMHERQPLHSLLDRSRLASRFEYLAEPGLFDVALAALARNGKVRISGPRVGVAGRGPQLSKNEQKLLEQLVETFRRAGFPPPTVEECQASAVKHRESVPQLLAVAAADGFLVEVGPGFYLHEETDRALRERLASDWNNGASLTVAEIRDMLGATRKHVVPYCEYLDRIGFTRREGDRRYLVEATIRL
jgi:selenocysteine-specific elongation factor